jgi:hypothetical protein
VVVTRDQDRVEVLGPSLSPSPDRNSNPHIITHRGQQRKYFRLHGLAENYCRESAPVDEKSPAHAQHHETVETDCPQRISGISSKIRAITKAQRKRYQEFNKLRLRNWPVLVSGRLHP